MFTGLVMTTGTLVELRAVGPGARISLRARFDDEPLTLGESIAVSGVCLTVDAVVPGGFEAGISAETLARTTLGGLKPGSQVHLERALRASDRLGGHIVTGHVDGVATLARRKSIGDSLVLAFRVPAQLKALIAQKGSVTLDGVSLTVNAVAGDTFEVAIIPHTLQKTTLGELSAGQHVNLEVDVMARYVARLLTVTGGERG